MQQVLRAATGEPPRVFLMVGSGDSAVILLRLLRNPSLLLQQVHLMSGVEISNVTCKWLMLPN